MQNAIVFGASSTIALEVINKLASDSYNLYLFVHNIKAFERVKSDLVVRYPNLKIEIESFDAEIDINEVLEAKIDRAFNIFKTVDLVLVAHGTLPEQKTCEVNWLAAKSALQINGLSVIEICHNIANKLKQQDNLQQQPVLAVISSAAGIRGRQSNYIYGTAKGMINIYLQGLRQSLFSHNIHVLTIIPGFTDTKMTAKFKKNFLWAKPSKVANDIFKAIRKKKNIIYTPGFWRYIMFIIKAIPEIIFKRLKM